MESYGKFKKHGTIHKFIDVAIEEALNSKLKNRHGCVIVCDGNIIGKGCNEYRKDGHYLSYNNCHGTRTKHAEMVAIKEVHSKGLKKKLKKATLIVVRLPNTYDSGHIHHTDCQNSKPCSECHKVIKKWNIRRVFHS